ncbi:hypothetical protein [Salinirussus salinus]|uniref:hypothetical protein n=1 Tax=Salinirussus salinus TaxID=1198300 RepID=UPI001357748A|nr:hypothetical protein [Salinirussus salinus]
MNQEQILKALGQVPAAATQLRRSDFDLSNGTPQQRSKIAEYRAETPLLLRPTKPLRLVFTTVEQFQTPGDGSETSYDLSHDVLETPNTENLLLYEGGSRVQPDAVDYAGDSFTYTGPGSQEYLTAFYVFRDPVQIEIERQGPRSQGALSDVPLDDVTSLLHERNQNQEPVTFAEDGDVHPLDLVVPQKWRLEVYAKGDAAGLEVAYDDSATDNPQGVDATNALLSIPVRKAQRNVDGLAQAVKRRLIEG